MQYKCFEYNTGNFHYSIESTRIMRTGAEEEYSMRGFHSSLITATF